MGITPTITYLAGIRSREDRQIRLKKSYQFDCNCVLCETEKEAPAVDYKELIRRRDSLYASRVYGNAELDLAKGILLEMKQIFCKYDERITNLYDHTLEKLVVTVQGPNAFMVDVSMVKEFAKEVEENLRITFGIDYRDYKYFDEELNPRLQMAK